MEEHVEMSLQRYDDLKEDKEINEHIKKTYDYLFSAMNNFDVIETPDRLHRTVGVKLDKQMLRDLFKAVVGKDASNYILEFEIIEEE